MDVFWYIVPATLAWVAYIGHHMRRAYIDPNTSLDHLSRVIAANVAFAGVNIVIVLLIYMVRASL